MARTRNDRERRILELVGATRIVSVEVEMGQPVARSLITTDVIDSTPHSVPTPRSCTGRPTSG